MVVATIGVTPSAIGAGRWAWSLPASRILFPLPHDLFSTVVFPKPPPHTMHGVALRQLPHLHRPVLGLRLQPPLHPNPNLHELDHAPLLLEAEAASSAAEKTTVAGEALPIADPSHPFRQCAAAPIPPPPEVVAPEDLITRGGCSGYSRSQESRGSLRRSERRRRTQWRGCQATLRGRRHRCLRRWTLHSFAPNRELQFATACHPSPQDPNRQLDPQRLVLHRGVHETVTACSTLICQGAVDEDGGAGRSCMTTMAVASKGSMLLF
ncbi:unnamed protein product [Urochloa humidicola]